MTAIVRPWPKAHAADWVPTGMADVLITDPWGDAIDDFAAFLRVGARTPRTIQTRRYWLGRLRRGFVDLSPWDLTTQDLIGWAAGHDWAPSTRKCVRNTLATFYRWAVNMGHTQDDPAAGLPSVTVPRGLPRPTPEPVFDRALLTASARDRLLIRLAGHAGLRREEIATLRWADVEGQWLTIAGKGGHTRRVPIGADFATELEQVRRLRASGQLEEGWRFAVDPRSPYLFPGLRDGQHMHVDAVGKALGRALGTHSGHTLRHRFATKALAGSKDIRAVQTLMGHRSIETTQIYTLVEDQALVEAAACAA